MKYKSIFLLLTSFFLQQSFSQSPRGKLFIIGGGNKTEALMKKLVAVSALSNKDYIAILPMSSSEPDSAYYFMKEDLEKVCSNAVVNFNFSSSTVNNKAWLDSLHKAKLIFITGGDQNRFMKIVLNTPVYTTIHAAYNEGAVIAGTSAGAAVMSKEMITGNEKAGDSIVSGDFKTIEYNKVEIKEGLGLIKNAVIDQHFIKRSRYNRLLSVLAAYPSYPCIGIDESTAIIIENKKVTVTGSSQVIKLSSDQTKASSTAKKVAMKNIHMDILVDGDTFLLP